MLRLLIDISQLVLEQLSRPRERRCPIAKASNEVVELLSEHWAIFAPGCTCLWSAPDLFNLNCITRFDIYNLSAFFLGFL